VLALGSCIGFGWRLADGFYQEREYIVSSARGAITESMATKALDTPAIAESLAGYTPRPEGPGLVAEWHKHLGGTSERLTMIFDAPGRVSKSVSVSRPRDSPESDQLYVFIYLMR
jgi:hypothetical protein